MLLGFIELAARGLGVEPLEDRVEYESRVKIRQCRWGPRDFEQTCDPDRYRAPGRKLVFAYGGSSLVWKKTGRDEKITNFLGKRLHEVRPGEYRVFNLGSRCKDSVFVRRCVDRTLEAEPAVVVLYTGHNDFSGFMSRSPRVVMWMSEWGAWLMKLDRTFARTHGYSLVNRRAGLPVAHVNDPRQGLDPEEIAHAERVILDAYSDNLRRIIERAGERGTTVVLATVVSNLHEFPTRRPDWPDVLARERQAGTEASPWLASFAEGIRLHRAGRYEEALASFERARDADPRTRAPSLLNPRIREIAARHDHAVLADVEAELEALGARPGIGCNFFGNAKYCDGVHPNARTNELIGTVVADAILGAESR